MCKAVKKSQSGAGRRSLRLGVAEPVLNELRRPQRECPGCGEYDAQVRLVHHQGRQRTEGDIFTLDWDGSTTSTRGGVDKPYIAQGSKPANYVFLSSRVRNAFCVFEKFKKSSKEEDFHGLCKRCENQVSMVSIIVGAQHM